MQQEEQKQWKQELGRKAGWATRSILAAYTVTVVLLLLLALLLYKAGLSEQNVNVGIVLIYVISAFAAGFVFGKLAGQKKYLWGLIGGVLYDLFLLLVTVIVFHGFQQNPTQLLASFLICAGSGMLGGMIA